LVSLGIVAPPIDSQEFLFAGTYHAWQRGQKPFEALTSWTGIVDAISPSRIFLCGSVARKWNPHSFPHWVSGPCWAAISHLTRTDQVLPTSSSCLTACGRVVSVASHAFSAERSTWTVRL